MHNDSVLYSAYGANKNLATASHPLPPKVSLPPWAAKVGRRERSKRCYVVPGQRNGLAPSTTSGIAL